MKLHVFNPEHDLALAAHQSRFTAPRAGRQLRHDLGFLPALWAGEGDVVWVDDITLARLSLSQIGIEPKATLADRAMLCAMLRHKQDVEVEPWGWNLALRQQLLDCGMSPHLLPTDEQLDLVRRMSHRAWGTTHLLRPLTTLPGTIGEAHELRSVDEVKALTHNSQGLVVKAPWSSSGRGMRYLRTHHPGAPVEIDPPVANWMANVIERQGSLMAEPLYNKTMDFGMEFESDGRGTIAYRGLSLFSTTHGAYTGNLLDTEAHKLQQLHRHLSPQLLGDVKHQIISLLSPAFNGTYRGPFGIDMMVVTHHGTTFLHPCVELNLRRTMGHAALSLSTGLSPLPATMLIRYDGRYHLEIESMK